MSPFKYSAISTWTLVVFATLSFGCGADRSAFIPEADAYDVRILRDEWGVPHIFGKTDACAAYGLGYAHSEDDWTNMEEAMLTIRGKMASVNGKDGAIFDYLVQLFRIRAFVDAQYETELSAEFRAVAEGYAAGITHFAALHPEKFKHLELPVTGRDIVAGATFKSPFFYELQNTLQELFAEEEVPISKKGIVAWNDLESVFPARSPIGSNAWAIAPHRSSDGATRLAINSHMPWTGQVTWYEAHVVSEEGWNMTGGTFPGGPVIFSGHDEAKGWCHTINRPDLVDVYALEINPDNGDQYRFDGGWRDFEIGSAPIKVKLWGPFSWTVKRPLLWSVHGPVLDTPSGLFALRFAGYGEIGQLEQWYHMNKAKDFDAFYAAMARHQHVSLNTVYADRDGRVLYVYNGQFPERKAGVDWRDILPGDDPSLLSENRLGFDAVPQIIDPPSGFVQSCNNSPYHSTDGPGNPRPEDFSAEMGLETYMTNRGLRALEVYGSDPSITREAFYAYKYDKAYSDESAMAEFLGKLAAAELPDDETVREGAALLANWDRRMERDSMAAALAILAAEPYMEAKRWGDELPDPVAYLQDACELMMQYHGSLDVRWEDMLRLRRGKTDLGLGGGPDVLRAIDIALDTDGKLYGVNGDCYFTMVEWDANGQLRSESIHQFGSATVDEASPHYADQAPLFAREEMRPTLLEEEAIREHLKVEYRPGDFTEPWYTQ